MDQVPNLNQRQIDILRAVIDEYINSAEPVGSDTLEKKHNLGVSPATIRNEMVRLTEMKLLKQPHTSAGRVPTPAALRYYVAHLMKPESLSVAEEVAVKEKIWDYRQEVDKLLREATKTLAEKTKALALTATKDGDLYYAGTANILDMPEFYDFELTHELLAALDHFDYWSQLLSQPSSLVDVILGEEMGTSLLSQCGFIYSRFESPHVSGAIGVVGPTRLNYPRIFPKVRYVAKLIGEFASNW